MPYMTSLAYLVYIPYGKTPGLWSLRVSLKIKMKISQMFGDSSFGPSVEVYRNFMIYNLYSFYLALFNENCKTNRTCSSQWRKTFEIFLPLNYIFRIIGIHFILIVFTFFFFCSPLVSHLHQHHNSATDWVTVSYCQGPGNTGSVGQLITLDKHTKLAALN